MKISPQFSNNPKVKGEKSNFPPASLGQYTTPLLLTVEVANGIDVVLMESEVWVVFSVVEPRHDGVFDVGMSQAERVTQLMHRYLQQIRTCTQQPRVDCVNSWI